MSFLGGNYQSKRMTFDAALRDIVDKSPRVRTAAAYALGGIADPVQQRRAIQALIAALDDDRPEVRVEAASSVGAIAAESLEAAERASPALTALVKRLDDTVPAARQNAAIALGAIGHPDGFAPLVDKLASGPADLRYQAATSLAEIDPPRAYDILVPALADKDPQVVSAVALSLGAIGDARAIPALKDRLAHPDAAARFDVAYALADLRDPSGRGTLINALVEEERAWDAVTALGNLKDAGALGAALTTKKVPVEATTAAAGKVLQLDPDGLHASAAKRVLLAALKARKTHVRALAVEQLGRARAAWARSEILKIKRADLAEGVAVALRRIDGEIIED